jgi:hypothetical protein
VPGRSDDPAGVHRDAGVSRPRPRRPTLRASPRAPG